MVSNFPFSLYQFMPVIEKENIIKRQKKNKDMVPISVSTVERNIHEVEEVSIEEEQRDDSEKRGMGKYILLILAFFAMGTQFINIIPGRIKMSCLAASILFIAIFFVLLFVKKEKKTEIKVENTQDDYESWEVGETVFFEPDKNKETWKLQWKERGRKKQVVVEEFPCKIGKIKEEVSVLINDISVSRVHCQLVKKENRIAIMDLNSTNGTAVNGISISSGEIIEIEKNDEILIGKVKVLVV